MSLQNQMEYKYVFYIDGWAAAYRYSTLMGMNNVILKIESIDNYQLWFFDQLESYSIENNNIETADHISIPHNFTVDSIQGIIDWCTENDDICNKIASNALRKYNLLFEHDYMLDYMQHVCDSISRKILPNNVSPHIKLYLSGAKCA